MNKTRAIILAATGLLVIIFAATLTPLDTYTIKHGCHEKTIPVSRLSLLMGDSLKDIKAADTEPNPYEGCSRTIKYVLYAI